MRALVILLVLAGAGAGGWYLLKNENLERRPPEFDALRLAILKETHLEADLKLKPPSATQGEVHLVVFPHVPARADKTEIERVVRALVKQHLPKAKEVDVQFGDNLNFNKKPPRGKLSPGERAMERLLQTPSSDKE